MHRIYMIVYILFLFPLTNVLLQVFWIKGSAKCPESKRKCVRSCQFL